MKKLSETDDSQPDSILRVVDLIATVGIMAMVVGIVLFTLFTPGSFGATSPRDFGASASVTTTSESFQGPERPPLETMGKEPIKLNLETKDARRMPSQVKDIPGIGGNRSANEIRADETIMHLLAPWQ
ncbi:MAG: hypothetical protein ACREI2_09805 [Nitrospiraceae bacterium]